MESSSIGESISGYNRVCWHGLHKVFYRLGHLHMCPNHLRGDSIIFATIGATPTFSLIHFFLDPILSNMFTYPTKYSHRCYIELMSLLSCWLPFMASSVISAKMVLFKLKGKLEVNHLPDQFENFLVHRDVNLLPIFLYVYEMVPLCITFNKWYFQD